MVDEDTICSSIDGSKRGFDIADAAAVIDGKFYPLNADDPINYEWLRVRLRDDRWIIAEVFGREIGKYVESFTEPLRTKWSPLSQDLGLHAVTLVGLGAADFQCLDPYHCADGQPFGIPGTVFARVWTGKCVVSSRLPWIGSCQPVRHQHRPYFPACSRL